MKRLLALIPVFLFLVGASAGASEITVKARAYSASNCAYYSTSIGDLIVTYKNENLPWGSQVFLKYGFRESTRSQIWQRQSSAEAVPVAPYTWQTTLSNVELDARGSYYFSDFEFVFELRLPDQPAAFDNGGRSPLGYYQSPLPQRACSQPTFYETLPVISVSH